MLSIVMLLQTLFNGTLLFILNLVILNTNAQLLKKLLAKLFSYRLQPTALMHKSRCFYLAINVALTNQPSFIK